MSSRTRSRPPIYEGCLKHGVPHYFRRPTDEIEHAHCSQCKVRLDVWRGQMAAVYGKDENRWPM